MNMKLQTLAAAIAVTSLVACSDTSDESTTTQNNLVNDAATPTFLSSPSLAGAPNSSASDDLTIFNVSASGNATDTGTTTYTFSVVDLNGASVPTDNLSVALEIAASGSFTDAYRISLFDLRESEEQPLMFTARGAPVDLPAGAYQARLVVNPSWRYSFDIAPVTHRHTSAFHFVDELDYRNNASDSFQLQVNSATQCVEDGFENNDNYQSAQPIPAGGQIEAALCEDHMDMYSVRLSAGESATIAFHYSDPAANLTRPTSYTVLDASLTPVDHPGAARDSHTIDIEADADGTYYLALHGARSGYRLTRFSGAAGPDLADDFADSSLFANGSELAGPQSWLLGQITLQKLAITPEKMLNQTVDCGRITTQYDNGQPVAYVTPSHFADIHEFQFLQGGQYLVDGELHSSWSIANDDVTNPHWYHNEYPGYAERVSDERWRYWTADGLAYVECSVEL